MSKKIVITEESQAFTKENLKFLQLKEK